jgi:excisionase family DNA binding protein
MLDKSKPEQHIHNQAEKPITVAVKRLGYSVKEACETLGCSESHGWKMLKNGQLKGVSLGRRTIIPVSEIERVLSGDAA